MPKKKTSSSIGSLKKPSQEVEQTKQVPKPGKLGKEIDDIFGGKKKKSNNRTASLKQVEKPAVVVQEAKQVPKSGKLGTEIDDIFGGRKKKKPELEKPEESKEEIAKKKRKMKRKRNEVDGFSNSKTRPRKRTEDGLLVYTEDELGLNKAYAGDTHLCPFDCTCCF